MLLFGAVLGVQAQKRSIYQGEVDLGVTYGPFGKTLGGVSLQTVQGARIGDHFSVGGGLGAELVIGGCDENHDVEPYMCCHDGIMGLVTPVFLNFKGYLDASKRTTGYISFDLGLIPIFESHGRSSAMLYACPAVGIKARKFKADLGYKFIGEYHGFQLRFGLFLGGGKQKEK
mgnify:CR=1 FL=1